MGTPRTHALGLDGKVDRDLEDAPFNSVADGTDGGVYVYTQARTQVGSGFMALLSL